MKNLFLLFLFIFPLISFAQLVVNDPVMSSLAVKEQAEMSVQTANMVKRLAEATKSSAELKKTTDFLKKNHERLSQINSAISNLSKLSSMIERQGMLIRSSSEMVSELGNSDLFTLDEMNTLHMSMTKNIKNLNDIVKMLDIVLKPKTKMSDGERLSILRDLEKDFSERQTLLQKNVWDYKRIKNQRLSRNALKTIQSKKE